MAKKYITKVPKYKMNDILKWINPTTKDEYTVILDERHDNNRTSDISWWAYAYPEKGKRFGKYKIAGAKRRTVNRKMKLKNGDSFLKLMGTGEKLLSSIKKQNDYAYNHYNRKNLNPSTF